MNGHVAESTSMYRFATVVAALSLASCAESGAQEAIPDALEMRLLSASPYSIHADPELDALVSFRAEAAYAEHCAACHGPGLEGRPGVPNLVDFDWLWGISFEETSDVGPVMELQQTILYGVRNTDCPDIEDVSFYGACADTRFSQMPGYGELGAFDAQQLDDITEYVLFLSGNESDEESVSRGEALWPVCTECHGPEGAGYKPYGGPDLTDETWLFGGDRATVRDVIANGRTEVCPAWVNRLDAATIKALAVYIWARANGRYQDSGDQGPENIFEF